MILGRMDEDDLKVLGSHLKMAQTNRTESGKIADINAQQASQQNQQMNRQMAGGSVPMAGGQGNPWQGMQPTSQDVMSMNQQFSAPGY